MRVPRRAWRLASGSVFALLVAAPAAEAQNCARIIAPGFAATSWGPALLHFTVTVDPSSLFCPAGFSVNVGAPWLFPANVVFDGSGAGSFDVYVDTNFQPFARDAALTVSDGLNQAFVAQAPYTGCAYVLSATDLVAPASPGAIEVRVDAEPASVCSWSAATDTPWLGLSNASGVGDGVFIVQFPANTDTGRRVGTVRLQDQTLAITQLGAQPLPYVELGGTPGPDPVLYDPVSGEWRAFSVTSAGGWRVLASGTWLANATVMPADFNGDALTDLLVYDSAGNWTLNMALPGGPIEICDPSCGPRMFAATSGTWLPGATPTPFDANGDGRTDLFLYNPTSGEWVLSLADAAGQPVSAGSGLWASGWQIYAARLDADASDDLFLYNGTAGHPNQGLWFRVYSRAGGAFEYVIGDIRWAPGWKIVPGDFDGDGQTEMFLYGAGGSGYWFLVDFRGQNAAYFGGLWAAGWEVDAADFNGDARTDLFVYQAAPGPLGGLWFKVLSDGAYGFEYIAADVRWATGWRVSIADLDLDGISDVFLDGRSDGLFAEVLTRDGGHSGVYVYGTGWPAERLMTLFRKITP